LLFVFSFCDLVGRHQVFAHLGKCVWEAELPWHWVFPGKYVFLVWTVAFDNGHSTAARPENEHSLQQLVILGLLWQLDRMFLTLTIFMMWACMSFYACIQPYTEKQKRKEILFLKTLVLTRTINIFWDFNWWKNELWTINAINGNIKLIYIRK